jgi:hypothetical protein
MVRGADMVIVYVMGSRLLGLSGKVIPQRMGALLWACYRNRARVALEISIMY